MNAGVVTHKTPEIEVRAARLAIGAAAAPLLLLASLHVLSPEFDPSLRVVSEYALGHYGWVLSLLFLTWGIRVDDAFYFVAGATTRQWKNLAQNAHCVITVESSGLDLVVEGETTKVSDEIRLQQIADAYAVQGWHPTVRNGVFYAVDGAPGAGPPPYEVYEVVPVTVFGLGRDEPYGSIRWRF